ncbi:MAG: hypothetical protein GWO02_07840, partial [Gammaproteobacteria bacterium]|nr:hypothetical protein [Gammaproteobacteria bacterium]
RLILLLLPAATLLLACGGEENARVPAGSPPQVAGHYEVTGVTVETGSGAQRPLRGTIVLTQEGNRYAARFELTT